MCTALGFAARSDPTRPGNTTNTAIPRSTPATGYAARNPNTSATTPPTSAPTGISPQPTIR
ncbi:MAG TPA: hypothetical protein VHV82_17810 [Sporichthyaceae bacterium]|nr:hypothetical protein [Sporichthyaceae bacterium]